MKIKIILKKIVNQINFQKILVIKFLLKILVIKIANLKLKIYIKKNKIKFNLILISINKIFKTSNLYKYNLTL